MAAVKKTVIQLAARELSVDVADLTALAETDARLDELGLDSLSASAPCHFCSQCNPVVMLQPSWRAV